MTHLLSDLAAILDASAEPVPTLTNTLVHGWSWPVLPLTGLSLATAVYLRGWRLACSTRPRELPVWRVWCFVAGMGSLWIALASPIDALDDYLLAAHMIQHFLLMSVAPPLLVLGAPVVPMLRGMPRWFLRHILRLAFANRRVQRVVHTLADPAVIWVAANAIFLGWHAPAAFEMTFRSEAVHNLEHLCFFTSSAAYWWVVLAPWPSRPRWPRWAMIPYLLSADLINTILSALLTFSGRVVYPSYDQAPRVCSLTALQDQIMAGSEMWLLNSTVFLVAAVVLTIRVFSPGTQRWRPAAGKLMSETLPQKTIVLPQLAAADTQEVTRA